MSQTPAFPLPAFPVVINDSTLRDGEQTPGVAFTLDEKVKIALALEAAGVDEVEAGTPAMGGDELEAVDAVNGALTRARVIAWCRMSERDVDAALDAGVTAVNLSAPMSDRQIKAKFGTGRLDVLERIRRVVTHARRNGLDVAVGGEDASRADLDFVCAATMVAEDAGARRFRFADTLGVLDPFATHAIFRRLCAETDLELEFHGHNDLGLATANTLAAVRAGATHVSVCVLGLGERAGNAALEEVVAGLRHVGGRETNVNFHHLPGLAALVAEAAGRAIPSAKPIVGGAVFTHESGIHVSGLIRDPQTYEAIDPTAFGRSRRIVLGKHSGMSSVSYALRSIGIDADPTRTRHILDDVRATAARSKRAVEVADVVDFYNAHERSERRIKGKLG
jgi:homocitrate synthase NifV